MQQAEHNPAGAPPYRITAPAPLTSSEAVAEFETTWREFVREMQPRGIIEQTLVYHAATLAWRLRRLPYLESTLIGSLFQSRSASKELQFLSSHESRLMRTFHQVVREIESRHRDPGPRAGRTGGRRTAPPPEAPAPAPLSDFHSQAVNTAAAPSAVPPIEPGPAGAPPAAAG